MTDRSDEPTADRPPIIKLSPARLDELRARYADDEDDDEPLGGDPACWAHLFEDDEADPHPCKADGARDQARVTTWPVSLEVAPARIVATISRPYSAGTGEGISPRTWVRNAAHSARKAAS